jgi:hypothetical protein
VGEHSVHTLGEHTLEEHYGSACSGEVQPGGAQYWGSAANTVQQGQCGTGGEQRSQYKDTRAAHTHWGSVHQYSEGEFVLEERLQ